MNDIYFGKVLFSSPLLVSLGSQDRNIDHKWRVFQGYDISPKRITVWLTHHISLESPVFYRISIFISIQFLLQSIKPSVATCEARIMEEKTWNRLKVGIENRMLITLGPGSLDINLLFLSPTVVSSSLMVILCRSVCACPHGPLPLLSVSSLRSSSSRSVRDP